MNTKKLLTSFAVFGVMSMPAFADIANNAESATCDSGTIGVSDGSTILEAQWTAQSITCPSGTYLEADDATCTACPTGSYCAGATYTFNGTDLGITGACESGYTTDGSASAQSDCYRACTTSDIAHSTAVSGKYYYGDNNQCGAVTCASGYTPKALDLASTNTENMNRNTFASIYGQGAGSFQEATFGVEAKGQSYYGITTKREWASDFSDFGTVRGTGICSTTQGYRNTVNNNDINWNNPTTFANFTDETGETGAIYCYCNMTGYRATGESSWASLSSSWVYINNNSSAVDCANYCANSCANYVGSFAGFRSALFGTVQPGLASCEANTIGITWKPQNGEENIIDQCTYNGAVTIPATPSKVGYDFAGWHVNNAQ